MRRPLRTRSLSALPLAVALCGLFVSPAWASDQLAYVANQQAGTISQVDLATGVVGSPISVGAGPDAIAITPNGAIAYVADYASSKIVPVALATGAVGTPIMLGDKPNAIAIAPNGETAYVVSDAGRDWPIKLADSQVGNPTQIPANADALAIAPGGATAYVTDVAAGTISPVSLANGGLGAPINVDAPTPDAIAITPDGSTAYVASNSGGTITPVTLATGVAGPAIASGSDPTGLAISADGSTAYVTNSSSGQITPVALATGVAGTPIAVGSDPSAIALVPPGGITVGPLPRSGGGTGGRGDGAPPATLGNQQLSVTVSGSSDNGSAANQSCRPTGSAINVRVNRRRLPHGARLTLHYVTVTLGHQAKRVRRLPASIEMSLRGLTRGAHRLSVRAFYTEKLAGGGRRRHKLTVTISRALRSTITIC